MYLLNPRLAADIFDGEYIIANLDTGLYYSIQGVAVFLVDSLLFEEAAQVIHRLKEAFPEDAPVMEQELPSLLKELLEEEILVPQNAGSNGEKVLPAMPATYVPGRFNRYADMQDLLMLDPIHDVDENGWTVQNTTPSTAQR